MQMTYRNEVIGGSSAPTELYEFTSAASSSPRSSGLESHSDCATLRQGKFLLAFREHLNTNMVSAGRAVFFNAAEHCFQVSTEAIGTYVGLHFLTVAKKFDA
jgi:hypothetical protein